MTVHAIFDEFGTGAAFFIVGVNCDTAPSDSIEISEEQWQDWINNAGLRRWDGTAVVPYLPPAPTPAVPSTVHAYQFAGQAAAEGLISANEARAWAGAGAVPPTLQAAVDRIVTDSEEHDRVTFFLVGATEFPRQHPNTIALGAVFGKKSSEELDAFFIAAGDR